MVLFSYCRYKWYSDEAIGNIHWINKIHVIIVLCVMLHLLHWLSVILHFNYTLWKKFPSSLHMLVMRYSFI
jgi:hypothetical protein